MPLVVGEDERCHTDDCREVVDREMSVFVLIVVRYRGLGEVVRCLEGEAGVIVTLGVGEGEAR